MNMILCRWSYKSYQNSILAKYVLQNINQNISLNVLLNIIYLTLFFCNIGHSCSTRRVVTLIKNNERGNFTFKRHKEYFSNFLRIKYPRIL